jgi:hypothetical protein
VVKNRFFEDFIAGFKRSGVESFTQLQFSMLDNLIQSRPFQVTSPDVSCGSGKTSLTVAATIGLFRENDKIVFVNKPGRGESSLTKELKQLVEKFSGGPSRMCVATVLNSTDATSLVPESDVIITNCMALGDVLRAVVANASTPLPTGATADCKLYLVFDEAHKIFNHDGVSKMAAWAIEQEKVGGGGGGGAAGSQPVLSYVSEALLQLRQACSLHPNLTPLPIFLSAVGDFSTSQLKKEGADKRLSSSEVVEMCIGQWLRMPVEKLVNSGNNSERNYNNIFKIHREGAIQIGGVDAYGYAMVYEAMLQIAFKRLIEGRMLFIVRRQQVDTFSALLDAKIAECGSFFTYTSDRDYWNAVDEDTLRPLYNIVVVREDELDDLEGVNIDGLRAVYLFSLGRTQNLYQKMQGLGRVGRLGQEASYCFVMIDCATKKNGAVEAESAPFLLDALNSNGTCRPHIIEVKGAKALDVPSNIPIYSPPAEPPTPLRLQGLQKIIRRANRPQVCKFMRYCPKSKAYECPSVQRGYKCAWYHPRPADFAIRSTSLKCCTFNTSYCKKGVFRETRCHCVNSMVPISPLTASTVAWTAANPAPDAVLAANFPKLGEQQKQQKQQQVARATPVATAPQAEEVDRPNPRLDRPVCRFAAMDMYKCKTRREGKLCFFRHPEEASDCVSAEEYLEALRLSILNLNKTREKYGQKPLPFSPGLYSKYNYPGRFKSNLAQPVAPKKKPVTVPAPAQCLASVLAGEKVEAEGAEKASPLFSALQSAYEKKVKVAVMEEEAKQSPVQPRVTLIPAALLNEAVSVDDGFTDVSSRSKKQSKLQPSTPASASASSKKDTKINYFQLLTGEEDDDDEEEDDKKEKEEEVVTPAVVVVSEEEQKRVQFEQQRAQAAAEEISRAAAAAQELLAAHAASALVVARSGLRGAQVVEELQQQRGAGSGHSFSTTAAALATAFLSDQTASTLSYQLFSDERFGLGLKCLLRAPALSSDGVTAQVQLLEAVEAYCCSQDFARVRIKSGDKYLIDVLFRLLYAYDLAEEEAFFAWHEGCGSDSGDASKDQARLKAVLQTTDFFSWLLQDAEESEEEEQEECAVASSPSKAVAPTPVPLSMNEEGDREEEGLSKADRKALKQLRRQERVADRGSTDSKLSFVSSSGSLAMAQ